MTATADNLRVRGRVRGRVHFLFVFSRLLLEPIMKRLVGQKVNLENKFER